MSEGAAIAGVRVTVDGTPLDDALATQIQEVRVEDHLLLPDTFVVRIADPGLVHVDDHPFRIGARVEIAFGAPDGATAEPIMQGQVTALEPEFGRDGALIVARGLDASHGLNRTTRSETYQNSTVADIVRKVAGRAGLQPGDVDDVAGVQDFVQQTNETDWQFLQRLADRAGRQVVVSGSTLHFRPLGTGSGGPVTLRWGQELVAFRPRVTGVGQVEEVTVRGWDPSAKRAIEATAAGVAPSAATGVDRSKVVLAMNGGTLAVAVAAVTSQEEADAMAQGLAKRIADGFMEATGEAHGNPALRAGRPVRIEGVGARFSGEYVVSTAEHVFRGGRGYVTVFHIAGRERRGLAQLVAPVAAGAAPAGGGGGGGGAGGGHGPQGVVVGVVTQNDDPDGLGRVRVQFPMLPGDTESWWARVLAPHAGKERGLLMMPQVGDEVAVLFENGDPRRPYVVGSAWNGKDRPGDDLVLTDGSFSLRSDQDVRIRAVKELKGEGVDAIVLTSGESSVTLNKDGTIEVKGKSVTIRANGSLSVSADRDVSITGMGVSIDGGAGTVSVKGSQVQLG